MADIKDFEIKTENLSPAGINILVEPIQNQGQTKSGLIIPVMGAAGATPTLGKILKVGSESKYKPGETVIFRKYSLDEIKVIDANGEKNLTFVTDEDIICKIEDAK